MVTTGCFSAPHKPSPAKIAKNQVRLQLPYDLAWEAVNAVIIKNGYHTSARDPNNGIVEAQVEHGEFTLKDADCGQIRGIAWKLSAQPAEVASAVFVFYVKPLGSRESLVTVTATFSAPVQVPFHAMQSVQCTSRGVDEARLLSEIQSQAAITHRVAYGSPAQELPSPAAAPSGSVRSAPVSASSSVLRPIDPAQKIKAQSAPTGFNAGTTQLLEMPNLPMFPGALAPRRGASPQPSPAN